MPHKVLIVDDHAILREGIRLMLQRQQNWVVVGESANATEARADIARLAPDVVILDYGLPGENGIALSQWIRQAAPATKLLMLSGLTSTALVRACLQAGIHGFVSKEADGSEIVTALRVIAAGDNYLSPKAASCLAEGICDEANHASGAVSRQEITVLRGIAAGLTYKEIAQQMGISAKTVETYRERLVRKTGCRSKVALARYAAEKDLLEAADQTTPRGDADRFRHR